MTLVEECRTLANRLLQPHSPYVAEAAAGHLRKAADEIERQAAEIERLREALRDVCDPLGYLRRKAEAEGARLSGQAFEIANNLGFVQGIARAALREDRT